MDEIEQIREFRDGLPEPRAEARDAARAALMERFEPSVPGRNRFLRKRIEGAQMKTKIVMFAAAAVGAVAVLVVSAGAFDRTPVAPQLSAEESGVKPGVVPGEVQELHLPNGQKFYGEVSPCIKSDPSGYSNAELEDSEWCFHSPGKAKATNETGKTAETSTKLGHAKVYHLSDSGQVKVFHPNAGG
jgi:hypothetical protein